MRPRVLFAPRNIAGQGTEYQRALEPYGYEAEVWSYNNPPFGFSADRIVMEAELMANPMTRWNLFNEAVEHFDIFHFQFSRSLMPVGRELPMLWDLPLLNSLGKTLVMHFRGTDVRRRSRHIAANPYSYFNTGGPSVPEQRIEAVLDICRMHCHELLVSTPGLLDDVPESTWLPHMIEVDEWYAERGVEPRVPIVLHVPSRRSTKGSNVVDRLAGAAHNSGEIKFVSAAALSRLELRQALQRADIVVDSLGIGDYGLLSVEAMAAGAIAVAHVDPRNRERNPGVPVVEATAETLGQVLSDLARDVERRADIRRLSGEFVRRVHNLEAGGRALAQVYDRAGARRVHLRLSNEHPSWSSAADRSDLVKANIRIRQLERKLDRSRLALNSIDRVAPRLIRRIRRRVRVMVARCPLVAQLARRLRRVA